MDSSQEVPSTPLIGTSGGMASPERDPSVDAEDIPAAQSFPETQLAPTVPLSSKDHAPSDKPSDDRAILMYAQEHGMNASEVNLQMETYLRLLYFLRPYMI